MDNFSNLSLYQLDIQIQQLLENYKIPIGMLYYYFQNLTNIFKELYITQSNIELKAYQENLQKAKEQIKESIANTPIEVEKINFITNENEKESGQE